MMSNPYARFEAEEITPAGDRCVVMLIYRKPKDGKPWHVLGVDVSKIGGGKVADNSSYVRDGR